MEDSSSNTTLREIEKLKQKISGYRGALLTLKMGDSFDDYLIIKRELDSLKMQISNIEDFTKTFDGNQYAQSELYGEQVKQFALQLSVLNETVKEMSEEIFNISNKIKPIKNEETIGNKTSVNKKEAQEKQSNIQIKNNNDKTPSNNQSSNAPYQPSYIQLRNLPEQAIELQKNEADSATDEKTEIIVHPIDQRYFNQSYFQSNNTQSTPAYIGLNKKKTSEAPIHFKNFIENENLPTNNRLHGYHSPSVENGPEITNDSPLISQENEKKDPTTFSMDKPISESNNDSLVLEQHEQQQKSQPEISLEKIHKQQESSNVENKKRKSSLFFNIFRK